MVRKNGTKKSINDTVIYWQQKLLNSNKYYFYKLKPSMLEENMCVVYVIFDISTDEALYVGRTKKLRRRLYNNHLHSNKANAKLKKYIVEIIEIIQKSIIIKMQKHGLKIIVIFNILK